MIENYVAGVNAYIAKTHTDPTRAAGRLRRRRRPGRPAGLGRAGRRRDRRADRRHLRQGRRQRGRQRAPAAVPAEASSARRTARRAFHAVPHAATTRWPPTTVVDKSFPYENPGKVNPATTALPDYGKAGHRRPGRHRRRTATSARPTRPRLSIINGLQAMPKHMSNALVVNANHASGGHPIAVFGPQVSYFAPQILSELDLHSPALRRRGRVVPGHRPRRARPRRGLRLVGDLGRQRPHRPAPGEGLQPGRRHAGRERHVLPVQGQVPADDRSSTSTRPRCPSRAASGAPATLEPRRSTAPGTASCRAGRPRGGKPVAIVNQRSTYNHDVDSVVGFLGWGEPALTHDVPVVDDRARRKIRYTFNWFYVDNRDTGYFVSGTRPDPSAQRRPEPADVGHRQRPSGSGYLPAGQARARGQPEAGLLRQLEQQAGARVRRGRRPVRLRAGVPLDPAGQPAASSSSPRTTARSPAPRS